MIFHWNTWKKKNNPELYTVRDSTLGHVSTITPTLKKYGFWHTREERDERKKPKEQAKELIPEGVKEAVYYVYNHSRGYCSYLELFYKPVQNKETA